DPNAPTFTAVLGLDPSTCGGTDGTIVLSGLTATTSYDITYNDGTSTVTLNGQMTDGSGNITISGLSAGSYSAFTATLAGCTGNVAGPITLTDPNAPNPTVQFTQHPSCGNADGIITTSNLNPLTAYTIGYFDGSSVVNLGSLVSDASGNIIISGLTAGSYSNFTVLSGSGCLGTDNTTINLVDQNSVVASFIASPDNGTIPLSVSFTNTSVGATSYLWNFGNGSTSILTNPTAVYNDMGMFTATLIAMTGNCSDTFTVIIETFGKSSILIPNVFTPNNDGSNDVFTVEGTNLESVEGEIFNRWGQKMFEWKHVKGYWDGKTQSGTDSPDGTYFYIIKAKGLDGEEYFKKGGFSLIR
ncbi:MAG: gliding motility-associated C-terminal domain-containing protein, partial [Flavobacteriales bacterium]|nr:gliding motility-associated C-terminal domain-containing protein [Flavobacteriales bacterium]